MLNAVKKGLRNYLPTPFLEAITFLKHLSIKKIDNYQVYIDHVAKKRGVEIGGPSILFKTALPLYQKIESLDGVNFSNNTIWEGDIQAGHHYQFAGKKKGIQFILDATNLSQIKDDTYDFVLSSNCLEHIANPMKALTEWKRVINNRGCLILVLPNKSNNFDHRRTITSFDHILEDFNCNMAEDDLTHLEEILELHDLSMDLPAGNMQNFKARSLDNYRNRALHHHVFDLNLISLMLDYLELEVIQKNVTTSDYFILARKM